MGRTLPLPDLPPTLFSAMRPWIGAVETARSGMGADVTAIAANATISLTLRIAMTPETERALMHARKATDLLALELDRPSAIPALARADALQALDALTALLRAARPNRRAAELGLRW